MKFGRVYEIYIKDPSGQQTTILPPFSVKFSINRNTLASANECDLTIINLGHKTRQKIYKDRYSTTEYWQLLIKAGYNNKLSTVFQGNIYEAFSYKQKTEWYTKISGFDGMYGIQNGYVAQSYEANTSFVDMFKDAVRAIPEMEEGVSGESLNQTSTRGTVQMGSAVDVVNGLTDGNYYIDNETMNALNIDEVDTSKVIKLDGNQLLGTPRRRDSFLDVETLFFPEITNGVICETESSFEIFNGQYKVVGFTHDFEWSGAACGAAKTKSSLYAGTGVFQYVG